MTDLFGVLLRKRIRWSIYAVAALVLAMLAIFPQPYTARAKIVPGDSGAGSVGGIVGALSGGQAQNLASLFGDRGVTEVALQIARSEAVGGDVIGRLKLVGPNARFATTQEAQRALAKKVDVHTLLGGIIEVTTKDADKDFSLAVTQAYVGSIGERLGTYGRDQVGRKRRIVEDRLSKARERLDQAQAALDVFKRKNQLADPQAQLGTQLTLRTSLEAQLQAKLVELTTLESIAGPENPKLNVVRQQVVTLREQLAKTATPTVSAGGPSVGEMTGISLRYASLFRDYQFAQAIYDVYSRAAEEVSVQEIVSQDRSQVAVVDPPHVDSALYLNNWAVALLALIAALALFTEVYAPLTGLWGPARDNALRTDDDGVLR